MSVLRQVGGGVSRWIDAVAATIVAWLGWFSSHRSVRLVELENGQFEVRGGRSDARRAARDRVAIVDGRLEGPSSARLAAALRGSRAELVLQPGRFLFRPLELPGRAAEFLDGVVRSQIDRLTPWSAADAAFGWQGPTEAGSNRIAVTVVATARAVVSPYVQAIASLGPRSISVLTIPPDSGAEAAPVKVLEERARGALDAASIRRLLVIVLSIAALAAIGAVAADIVIANDLEAKRQELARRITGARTAARVSGESPQDAATVALRAVERRRHESPASVMILETLSQLLPDHTYVTEMRVEGDKLRLVGLTRDAPSLIGLIEQSGRFTRATFFAPTTRSPTDPGERFHIEAQIGSSFAPRS
jgi:general secretion pathway protein L